MIVSCKTKSLRLNLKFKTLTELKSILKMRPAQLLKHGGYQYTVLNQDNKKEIFVAQMLGVPQKGGYFDVEYYTLDHMVDLSGIVVAYHQNVRVKVPRLTVLRQVFFHQLGLTPIFGVSEIDNVLSILKAETPCTVDCFGKTYDMKLKCDL